MHDATQLYEWKKMLVENNYLFQRPLFNNRECHQMLTLVEDTLKAIIAGTDEPYRYIGDHYIPKCVCEPNLTDLFEHGWITFNERTGDAEDTTRQMLNPPLRGYQCVFMYMYSFFKHGKLNSYNAKLMAKMVTRAWDSVHMNTDRTMYTFVHENKPFECDSLILPVRVITGLINNMEDLNVPGPWDFRSPLMKAWV